MRNFKYEVLAFALVCGGIFAACTSQPIHPTTEPTFLVGPRNTEDIIRVANTDWLIASGVASPKNPNGHLYAIDTKTRVFETLDLGSSVARNPAYKDCSAPPKPETFSAQGLNIREVPNGDSTLYVVGHGGREAVEIFKLQKRNGRPNLQWQGCVLVPRNVSGNSIVPFGNDGFILTSSFDPRDQKALMKKMSTGEPTGEVLTWSPRAGWKKIPGSELRINNGIEISPDSRWLYVNEWAGGRIVRFQLNSDGTTHKRDAIQVGFLPDNIRRTDDNKLLVTGQSGTVTEFLQCAFDSREICSSGYEVIELDPETMKVRPIIKQNGSPTFGAATTAIRIGSSLWLSTYRGDRLAIIDGGN